MMLHRRSFTACAAALLFAVATGAAIAQTPYPARPVRLVVPYAPGGATDVIARMLAERLAAQWSQPVVVENRAGAGATVGAEVVAKAPADGYTLFETTSAHTISASLYRKLSYDPVRDFTPITLTATVPLVMVVGPSVPAATLAEFVAWAKAQPQGVTNASPGNGTAQHLTGALFRQRTGLQTVHVPYKGDTPMIADLIGGQVQFAFITLSAVVSHVKAGKLKAIGLAHARRSSALPEVPTFAELGIADFEAATWFGLFAPAGLATELRERLYRDVSAIVATPAFTQRLVDMGAEVNNLAPAAFEAFIRKETANWAEAVKLSGASVD